MHHAPMQHHHRRFTGTPVLRDGVGSGDDGWEKGIAGGTDYSIPAYDCGSRGPNTLDDNTTTTATAATPSTTLSRHDTGGLPVSAGTRTIRPATVPVRVHFRRPIHVCVAYVYGMHCVSRADAAVHPRPDRTRLASSASSSPVRVCGAVCSIPQRLLSHCGRLPDVHHPQGAPTRLCRHASPPAQPGSVSQLLLRRRILRRRDLSLSPRPPRRRLREIVSPAVSEWVRGEGRVCGECLSVSGGVGWRCMRDRNCAQS